MELLGRFVRRGCGERSVCLHRLGLGFVRSFRSFLEVSGNVYRGSSAGRLGLLGGVVGLTITGSCVSFGPFTACGIRQRTIRVSFLSRRRLEEVVGFSAPLPQLRGTESVFLFNYFAKLDCVSIGALAATRFRGSRGKEV